MSKVIYLVGSNITGEVKEHTTAELDDLAKVVISDMNMHGMRTPISGEPHSYDYFFNERVPAFKDDLTLIGYYVEDKTIFNGSEFKLRSELVQF